MQGEAQHKASKTCLRSCPKPSVAHPKTTKNRGWGGLCTPKCSQEPTNASQETPKRAQDAPQESPRGAEEAPKARKRCPRASQEGPRPLQNTAQRAQRVVLKTIFVGNFVRKAPDRFFTILWLARKACDMCKTLIFVAPANVL